MMACEGVAAHLGIDLRRARDVRVLVLRGYGINCEEETTWAFRAVGATTDPVHLADLLASGGRELSGRHILAFPGGFSFGDHVAAGRVLANRIRFRLGDRLARFVDEGGLVLGICNGFQAMVRLGLLPAAGRPPGAGLTRQQVSLVGNDRLGYRDAWVRLWVDPSSPCVFTRGLGGRTLDLPSRHAEGKLVFGDVAIAARIEDDHLAPVRYVDHEGVPTEAWPANPSGSPGGIAGLCDASGRLFGLMPHPDAYLYPENHPHFIAQRDAGGLPPVGLGMHVFAGGLRHVLDRS